MSQHKLLVAYTDGYNLFFKHYVGNMVVSHSQNSESCIDAIYILFLCICYFNKNYLKGKLWVKDIETCKTLK